MSSSSSPDIDRYANYTFYKEHCVTDQPAVPLNSHAAFINKLALFTMDLDEGRYDRSA